jgi:hypothetical protein
MVGLGVSAGNLINICHVLLATSFHRKLNLISRRPLPVKRKSFSVENAPSLSLQSPIPPNFLSPSNAHSRILRRKVTNRKLTPAMMDPIMLAKPTPQPVFSEQPRVSKRISAFFHCWSKWK